MKSAQATCSSLPLKKFIIRKRNIRHIKLQMSNFYLFLISEMSSVWIKPTPLLCLHGSTGCEQWRIPYGQGSESFQSEKLQTQ